MSEQINKLIQYIKTSHSPIYFKNPEGNCFVTFTTKNGKETFKIGSDGWRSFIQEASRLEGSLGIREEAIKFLRDDMYSQADRSNLNMDCFLRAGRCDKGDLYLDLGGSPRLYCKITPDSFFIQHDSPIPFWSTQKQLKLPQPEMTQDSILDLLKSLLNLENEDDAVLILAFMVKAIIPNSGPYPILCIDGIQGSAKSTTTRVIKKLIDPTTPELSSPPRSHDDLVVKAINGFLLAFDNLSGLSHDFADAFCRLSTGGGVSKRKLYTDGDEVSYDLMRPVIFNGIDDITDRPDLLDRTIIVHLKVIEPSQRVSEEEYWQKFNSLTPKMLGAFYSLTASVLRELPQVKKNELPRMADFARIGIAMEKHLRLEAGRFLEIYAENDSDKIEGLIAHSGLASAVKRCLEKDKTISGTPQEVFNKLEWHKNPQDRSFPYSPRGLTAGLKRLEPVLAKTGIEIFWQRRTSIGRRVTISYKKGIIPPAPRPELEIPF
jgi:hypothetical protein